MPQSDQVIRNQAGSATTVERVPVGLLQRVDALEKKIDALLNTFEGEPGGPASRIELRSMHRDLSSKLTEIAENLEQESAELRAETDQALARLRQDVEWLIRTRKGENVVSPTV